MTASDLARWDISLINQSLLKPDSYSVMFKEIKLKDGSGTGYGLGVRVRKLNGRLEVEHSGEVSGFTAENIVVPGVKAAVVVLVNQDAVGASGIVGNAIMTPLAGQTQDSEHALRILRQFQANSIDRSQFTELCNQYFTPEAIEDYSRSLQPLGEPLFISERAHSSRGGMTFRAYRIQFDGRSLSLTTFEMPDGKLEQFLIGPVQP
jgi:CubicO group peptidase (beta-lactamase class C family)